MGNITNIITLNATKQHLVRDLNNLIYGSVEIREIKNKKYLYVHFRDNGIVINKYVGEYSDDLYNLILNNNIKAKSIKKDIKKIDANLKTIGYFENELDKNVAINVDFAKKHLVDTIYNQAVLEGIAATYADTETIVEGGKVNNMTADDVLKVINLKHAWEFVLNNNVITMPTNFALLCEINKLIEEGFYYSAGKLRTTPVSIGGTKWKPELPIETIIKENLEQIFSIKTDIINTAIELLLYVMKSQIFIDGNKRTAVLFANHYLISHGMGLIVIPNNKVEEYKKLLIAYYEGKDENSIKKFLLQNAYLKI